MIKLSVFLLLSLWIGWASADGVLVAWQPDQVVWQPQQGVQGELISGDHYQRYQLVRYEVLDRIQRLNFLRQMRANPDVVFAELDLPVHTQASRPEHFPLLGFKDEEPLPVRDCYDVPIAVIDSGVDRNHTALNQGQVVFWDDKNFIATGSVQDATGHGTHIAGLIFAAAMPEAAVNGVCSRGQLLSIRFLGSRGGSIADAVQGIYHALDEGVKVINASWVASSSQALADAVQAANDQGVLLVAAAGNAGVSLDTSPSYPAGYATRFPLVVSVANLAADADLYTGQGSSNYGQHSVDLAAPGVNLLSTWLGGRYEMQTGTSMAAPLVTGALAATWHRFPSESAKAIKAALLNSLTLASVLEGKLRYPGYLNVVSLLESPEASLFQPTWFNYVWQENADILEFQGYLLDQVHKVEWISRDNELLYLTYRVNEAGQLLVDLPLGWEAGGQLLLYAAGTALQAVNVSDYQDLPLADVTDNQQELIWKKTDRIMLERFSGSGYWSAEQMELDGEVVLKISGRDLNAEWSLHFSGHPRLRLYDLYARSADGWQKLGRNDGWSLSDVREGKLVISTADDLSWVQKEVQHGVETQVMVLSAHTGVPATDSSRCFIATQVYGANDAPQVQVLRQFRDEVLLTSPVGSALVGFYYRHSPGWVEWMQDKPRLTAVIRWLLDGLVSLISFFQR